MLYRDSLPGRRRFPDTDLEYFHKWYAEMKVWTSDKIIHTNVSRRVRTKSSNHAPVEVSGQHHTHIHVNVTRTLDPEPPQVLQKSRMLGRGSHVE
jgi:hypothetical protein